MRRGRLLQLILGNMRGGKTEKFIREVRRLREHSDLNVACFRPKEDTRSTLGFIESRDKNNNVTDKIEATEFSGKTPEQILRIVGSMVGKANYPDVIALDESQFCASTLYQICEGLLERGHDLLIAGLALDFRREPFGPTLSLIGLHDESTKLIWKHPICDKCRKREARFPQRLIDGKPADYNEPQISVEGAKKKEKYEVRCESCHELPGKPF